jgi:hypothetical protein
MIRDQAVTQVWIRMQRFQKWCIVQAESVQAVVDEKYPRDNYRTKEEPNRDYAFGIPDVLELEREMRRRLKV